MSDAYGSATEVLKQLGITDPSSEMVAIVMRALQRYSSLAWADYLEAESQRIRRLLE